MRKKRLRWNDFVAEYEKAIAEGESLDESAKRGSSGPIDYFSSGGATTRFGDLLTNLVQSRAPSARPMPWKEIDESWFAELLRKAAGANHGDAVQVLLRTLLGALRVELPLNVFVALPKRLGRPRKPSTDEIVEFFKKLKPRSLTKQHLARAYYGEEFVRLSPKMKERRVDQCRRAVERTLLPDEIARIIQSGKKSGLK